MNNSKLWWNKILLAFLVSGSVLQAQVASTPPAPQVKPIPPNTSWTIKVTILKETPETEGPQLKEIHGQRSETLRHEVISWGTTTTERWLAGNYLLETTLDQPDVVPTPYSRNPRLKEARLASLPELDWIFPQHYKGIAEYAGKPCHYYEFTREVKPEIDNDQLAAAKAGTFVLPETIIYPHKAWIDAATGYPLAFEGIDYRYEYEFSRPGEAKARLTLPARFLQAARKLNPSFTP